MALPFISQYPSDKIPNRQTMTAEQFADAVHPYLNFWNDTTIPQVNAWRESLEQIRQDINAKHQDVMNQAVDGGYSQAYIDNKFNQIWHGQTFYVDAVNGDDANDGSSVSPFRTIVKAIDSVPKGGFADIYIKKGQEHIFGRTDYYTYIIHKTIRFREYGVGDSPTLRLTNRVTSDDIFYYNYVFLQYSTIMFIGYFNFIIDDKQTASSEDAWKTWFRCSEGLNFIGMLNPTITLKDGVKFISVDDWVGSALVFTANTPTITTNNIIFCNLNYKANCMFHIRSTSNIDNMSVLLGEIVRDSDGKPRNVISNIIL